MKINVAMVMTGLVQLVSLVLSRPETPRDDPDTHHRERRAIDSDVFCQTDKYWLPVDKLTGADGKSWRAIKVDNIQQTVPVGVCVNEGINVSCGLTKCKCVQDTAEHYLWVLPGFGDNRLTSTRLGQLQLKRFTFKSSCHCVNISP